MTNAIRNQAFAAAQALAERGDWAGARKAFERVLQHAPGDAESMLQLSYLESLAGGYNQAHEWAMKAFRTRPDSPPVIAELASRLRTFNEIDALFECIDAFVARGTNDPRVMVGLAAHLGNINETERALALVELAARHAPSTPPVLVQRAIILTSLGRFEEAGADLRRCLAISPGMVSAYWLLSRLPREHRGKAQATTLRKLLSRKDLHAEHVARLAYALHNELDDAGDIAGAIAALETACRAKRSVLRYSSRESRELVDALAGWSATSRSPDGIGTSDRVPIFIVGMHRSGTTLLEQLLGGHSAIRSVGEVYDFTSQMRRATDHHCRGVIDKTIVDRATTTDFGSVGAGYLEKMEWRLGTERYFTDKLPSNFLNLGFICSALPQARILHMVRDPVEVCFSNLRELFSDANPYSYDQRELAAYYRQYERLMEHWRKLWPERILDIDYAELTRQPDATLRKVAVFCRLDFEPSMLDVTAHNRGIATASAVQVRQGIVARDTPKWVPYADYLRPLIESLGA